MLFLGSDHRIWLCEILTLRVAGWGIIKLFGLILNFFYKSKISLKYNCLMVHSFKPILLESNKVIKFHQEVHWRYNILIPCYIIQNHRILQIKCNLDSHSSFFYSWGNSLSTLPETLCTTAPEMNCWKESELLDTSSSCSLPCWNQSLVDSLDPDGNHSDTQSQHHASSGIVLLQTKHPQSLSRW